MFSKIDTETAISMAKSMMFTIASALVTLISVIGVIVFFGAAVSATHPLIFVVCLFCMASTAWLGHSLAMYLFERSEEIL